MNNLFTISKEIRKFLKFIIKY